MDTVRNRTYYNLLVDDENNLREFKVVRVDYTWWSGRKKDPVTLVHCQNIDNVVPWLSN